MNEIPVPEKLSDLIALAIADCEALDSEVYKPLSRNWHRPVGRACYVCFAGAILARTLGYRPCEAVTPESIYHAGGGSRRWSRALMVLDYIRQGRFEDAIHEWDLLYPQADVMERCPPKWAMAARRRTGVGVDADSYFDSWGSFTSFLNKMKRLGKDMKAEGW